MALLMLAEVEFSIISENMMLGCAYELLNPLFTLTGTRVTQWHESFELKLIF